MLCSCTVLIEDPDATLIGEVIGVCLGELLELLDDRIVFAFADHHTIVLSPHKVAIEFAHNVAACVYCTISREDPYSLVDFGFSWHVYPPFLLVC